MGPLVVVLMVAVLVLAFGMIAALLVVIRRTSDGQPRGRQAECRAGAGRTRGA